MKNRVTSTGKKMHRFFLTWRNYKNYNKYTYYEQISFSNLGDKIEIAILPSDNYAAQYFVKRHQMHRDLLDCKKTAEIFHGLAERFKNIHCNLVVTHGTGNLSFIFRNHLETNQ